MAWINLFDVTYSALAGVYNKINMMVGVVSMSFTTAGSTMISQNLGARRFSRVNRVLMTVLAAGAVLAALLHAVMVFFPDAVYGIFTPDRELLNAATVLTIPIILNFYGAITRSAAFSLINGSGRSGLNLAVALVDGILARIGLAALLGFGMRLDCFGFWTGDSLAGFMPLIISLVFYLSGQWRRLPEREMRTDR